MAFTKITNAGFGLTTGTLVGVAASFSSTVSVGGTLTYEDVTNVDSVGLITARNGIEVTDKGVQVGTGATIDSAADNTLTFLTNGSERLRIQSDGDVGIGTDNPNGTFVVRGDDLTKAIRFQSNTSTQTSMLFQNSTTGYGSDDGLYFGIDQQEDGYFWHFESENLIFGTANTERLRIDSSGRLLLGTTTEGIASGDNLTIADSGNCGLTIRSGTSSQGNIFFSDGTSGNSEYDGFIQYQQDNQAMLFGTGGGTERMRIDSSGNMGIGEASADTRLHIKESTTGATGIFIQNSNGATNSSADLYFGNWNGSSTTTPQARIQAINKNVNTAATDLAFWTYSGSSTRERLRIDSDGDIHHSGSTTSDESNKLARYLVPSHDTNEEDVVVFQVENESSNNQITFGGGTASYNAANTIIFRTASAVDTTTGEYRARIDSNGDFLVQTTSNTEYTRTSGAGSWGYTADTGTNRGSIVHANNADNGWSMMYMNKYNWTNGDDGRYINFYKNGGSLSSIMLNSSGTIAYNTGSDYRLKENIVPMTNGITRIKQLLPKQFNMIDDPDNNLCDGFLAHEAQTVVPQAVWGTHNGMRTDEDGNEVPDYQGMDYGKLTPLLTAALQEAIAKIETLEAKVAALEG